MIINRFHVEKHLLGCLINGNFSHPMDEFEFREAVIDYEIFTSNYTIKLIAKAIYNLKNDGIPIDDVIVFDYITSKTNNFDSSIYLEVISCMGSYDSFLHYMKLLRDIDNQEKIMNRLKGIK